MDPAADSHGRLRKPLMVYDGDCHFCRRWIARWNQLTSDRVDYRPLQAAAPDYPTIPRGEFEREVKLILPGGQVYGGAAAVFRVLALGNGSILYRFALWLYLSVGLFRWTTDAGYRFVACHRTWFSVGTRWLWGTDAREPTYYTARAWFLRVLGLIYFAAFLSLRAQIDGLIGKDGILPFHLLMEAARTQLGAASGFLRLPTLCWLTGASDGALRFLCLAGMVVALLLVADVAPVLCLALLWALYLSLVTAGQVFLGFQWDILLLETGLLSLFVAPWRWRPGWWPGTPRSPAPPLPRVGLFLLRWLLFRLMLMSGVVKLTSGDATWRDLSALSYHYESQPLPTWVGWYAHQFPPGFQRFSTGFVLVAELVAPFLLFGPRRVRLTGCLLLVLLQILIALTGNYGFFNLMTLALCLLLLDDLQWPRSLSLRPPVDPATKRPPERGWRWPNWVLVPGAAAYVFLAGWLDWKSRLPQFPDFGPLNAVYATLEPFHPVNTYGLFRVMTRGRREIVIEGSDDREHWQAYTFRDKPGDPRQRPGFIAPHMPRLDWQMWFAALGSYRDNPWFTPFMAKLLEGSKPVTNLLAQNPFPGRPPRYVRAVLYDYRFTDPATRRRTGDWWQRELLGSYCPEFSLKNGNDP